MNKSIETLKRLALNPHYKMTEEEAQFFNESRQELVPKNKKHSTKVERQTGSFKKHDPELDEEEK